MPTPPAHSQEPTTDDANTAAPASAAIATALPWEEQVKQELLPFDAFPRLLACAKADQPPSAADCFRFQWFGLFYAGAESDSFLVRVRLPGGRLKPFQLLALAEITQELAGGCVKFNFQGGLDLPGVPVRACAEILRRLEEVGLSTRGTGGDCVQAVRGAEREGLMGTDPPVVYPLVCEFEQALAQSREFGNLPGPCEAAFRRQGEPLPPAMAGVSRIVFEARRRLPAKTVFPGDWPSERDPSPESWRMLLPGNVDLGVALTVAETTPVFLALLRVWSQRAERASREQATFAKLCEQLGTEQLRSALTQELGAKIPMFPPTESVADNTVDVVALLPIPEGRLLSRQLTDLAALALRHAMSELRFVRPGCLLLADETDVAAFESVFR